MTNRNLVRQVVINKDGSKNIVWHKKHFSHPQFLDRNGFWQQLNKEPKPNSKRQQKLAAQKEAKENSVLVIQAA